MLTFIPDACKVLNASTRGKQFELKIIQKNSCQTLKMMIYLLSFIFKKQKNVLKKEMKKVLDKIITFLLQL